jgi:glycosyltransferase involved in cell wall biosynthesis
MRIGIDCRLPTYQMGGISQSVLHLLPALAKIDDENDYILYHSRKESRTFVPQTALKFTRRDLWTPCHHRFERWALTAEILRDELDVFHSPDFIPPAAGAGRRVVTIHDLNFLYFPQFLTAESKRYYLDQIAWAAESADHIAADSHATRNDLIELLKVPANKVTTVHLAANPIYQSEFQANDVDYTLNKYDLTRGFILFVGTLEPRKNLPMLIQAYSQLRSEKQTTTPLILVGKKGWIYEEIFATIEKLELGTYVRHMPDIFDRELAHFYHAAGVLVTPSYYEGFGLPALEAQHCGCPVVVSNRGSLPEIVGPEGIMLEADDISGWVDTLALVLSDKNYREKMIKIGKEQARKFSWEKTARLMISIYADDE